MALLTFKMSDVARLAEELNEAPGFSATMDQLFDPEKHEGGVVLDAEGRTAAQVEEAGGLFWPSAKNIRVDALERCFQLVGDRGVYLITNAKFEGDSTPASRGTVAYANGCNPEVDEDYYENKVALFGGDDGTVTIPYQWYVLAKEKGKRVFKIKLSSSSVSLVM
ncbi:DUF3085 domain-containing protein [Marinobacter salicampi]|uniref:DUF3085 domain-containing protein n=1 Tax=Marinobacter salicampi TaxID=435907 RepID=UPI00140D9CA6|nr:DUF3085 domain-containing protein [Marinobacter salicampi]